MLILSRFAGEFVYLDVPACPNGCCPARRLRIGVSEVRGHKVLLAFDCPPEVVIMRTELLTSRQSSVDSRQSEPGL